MRVPTRRRFIVWLMLPTEKSPARLAAASAFMLAPGRERLELFLVDKRLDPTNLLIGAAAAMLACATIHRLASRRKALSERRLDLERHTGLRAPCVEAKELGNAGRHRSTGVLL